MNSTVGRVIYVLIGILLCYLYLDTSPVSYPEVIVPAARIIEREVPPGPPRIVERVKYVFVHPDVRAVAPGAVTGLVAAFCRPVVVVDTVRVPVPALIRSVQHTPSWVPLQRDRLFVSSMNSYGDLIGEDYRVRAGFGLAAGTEPPYQTVVRYPRLPVREVGRGLLWYAAFRLAEGVVF